MAHPEDNYDDHTGQYDAEPIRHRIRRSEVVGDHVVDICSCGIPDERPAEDQELIEAWIADEERTNDAVDWLLAVRKFGLIKANEMFEGR